MSERTTQANAIVKRYWKWSAAAGLIPVPLVDVLATSGVQLKMIGELAKLYEIPFREDRAKSIAAALIGGVTPPLLSVGALAMAGPALKAVPGIGSLAGTIATPAFNAAVTYALGRVFIQHFESGGTFLDLDPDKVREHFRQEFQGAPERAAEASVIH